MKALDLDDLLGTTARLAIVMTLADGAAWTFTDLKTETGLADGNLSVQTRKLVDAEYLAKEKTQNGNRQVTAFRLTELGRRHFQTHTDRMVVALGMRCNGNNTRPEGSRGPQKKKKPGHDDSKVW